MEGNFFFFFFETTFIILMATFFNLKKDAHPRQNGEEAVHITHPTGVFKKKLLFTSQS